MHVKFGAGRLLYAKMMAVVALVVWLPRSVTTAELMSGGDIRSSRALDTQTAAHTPASIKRSLRSNVDMPSDYTSNFEERLSIRLVAVDSLVQALKSKFRMIWWQKSINAEYAQLFHGEANPFESQHFLEWVEFANSKHPDSKADATMSMFLTLESQFEGNNALARILVAKTNSEGTQSIAGELLDIQVKKWVGEEKHAPTVFNLLGLDQDIGKLFEKPVVFKWADFAELRYSSRHPDKPVAMMIATLIHYLPENGSVDKLLVAGTEIESTNDLATTLLRFLRHKNGETIARKALAKAATKTETIVNSRRY